MIMSYLERKTKERYHDIRAYDERFCLKFELVENRIKHLEGGNKMKFVKLLNSYDDLEELLHAFDELSARLFPPLTAVEQKALNTIINDAFDQPLSDRSGHCTKEEKS